ncbi:MAG: DNA repair protein RecO [Acidimicrobiia bacterium]
MALYRDEGVILRTYRLGEADRIIVVLTRGRGKVRAVAKGVRKTLSRFGSRLEPMSHVALQLYEGRDLDTITQAESIDHFRALRDDLDRIARAASLLEATDLMTEEGEAAPRMYTMLLGALRTLAAGDHPLIVPAFFFKLLALEGYRPLVEACVVCGAADGLVAFDLDQGGLLCGAHRRGTKVSALTVALLRLVLGGGLGSALAGTASGAEVAEFDHLATRALEHHLERRLRSVSVLDLA